jgi:hypothetical protein
MTGQARAWAWVGHLREGGTTPWSEFHEEAGSQGPWLPGAIQLEVARRLNRVRPDPVLVERILDSSAPGRGQPDLELVGAGEPRRFGPPPVDPAVLPAHELVRMAVGVLAELVAESEPPPQRRQPSGAPWRKAFHLVGNPYVAEQTRTALARAGRTPGRRSPEVYVLADDLAGMLSDLWTWRVRHTVHADWTWWVGHWARRDQLPPRADLPRVLRSWARRVGPGRVHVVLGADPAAQVARLLGVRRPLTAAVEPPSPESTEVVRHANAVLRVLVDEERHQRLLDTVLLPVLAAEPGPRRAVPARHRDWVARQAATLRDELVTAEYPVHGDPDLLVPRDGTGAAGPAEEAVLDVALRALLGVKEAGR